MCDAPLILGFDTSGPHCAGAVLRGDVVLTERAEPMTRGQAERLMPLLEELLAEAGVTWKDLDALGVGVGPGNFTGIRIAVSAARGLALGLAVPAVGVTGLEAREAICPTGLRPAIPAPRDHAYILDGTAPKLVAQADAPAPLWVEASPDGLAPAIARIAATRWQSTPPAPAPLYVRPADAAPARDTPPALLDE